MTQMRERHLPISEVAVPHLDSVTIYGLGPRRFCTSPPRRAGRSGAASSKTLFIMLSKAGATGAISRPAATDSFCW
jgi:hypothetical protein